METILKRSDSKPFLISGPVFTGILTAVLLTFIHIKVKNPMLLMERFIHGTGWIEIVLLVLYAVWIRGLMSDPSKSPKVRLTIWTVFSIVFYLQLILGLLGIEKLLMSGKLHLPIPAMIIAGPVFRGTGFFMSIMFLGAMLVAGPAWCSHLCYLGAWDNQAAVRKKIPVKIKQNRVWIQLAMLALVVAGAFSLRLLGVSTMTAIVAGILFEVIGVFVILFITRRSGVMLHCTSFCPLGLLSTTIGKISPFRVKIGGGCNDCGVCSKSCRYDALNKEDIKKRKAGPSCTLCGDCIGSCHQKQIAYSFLKLSPESARNLFLTLVVSLHTVCLAVARI